MKPSASVKDHQLPAEGGNLGGSTWLRTTVLVGAAVVVTALSTVALYDRAMAHRGAGGGFTVAGDLRVMEAKRLAATLAMASGGDVEALAAVKAREANLTGVIATNLVTGETFVAWSLADGDAFAVGPVIDGTGANLTFRYELETLSEPLAMGGRLSAAPILESHSLVSQEEWMSLAEARHVPIGEGQRQMLAFYDPDCRYCQQMISDLETREGDFRVLLVPVSASDADAPAVAESFWPGDDSGTESILAHNALLERVAGRRITPALVYEDQSGRLRLKIGAPQSDERWSDLHNAMAPMLAAAEVAP